MSAATKLRKKKISTTAPEDGQFLAYDEGDDEWAPTDPPEGGSGSSSGSAGAVQISDGAGGLNSIPQASLEIGGTTNGDVTLNLNQSDRNGQSANIPYIRSKITEFPLNFWDLVHDTYNTGDWSIRRAVGGPVQECLIIKRTDRTIQMPAYGAGVATFDASGNITSEPAPSVALSYLYGTTAIGAWGAIAGAFGTLGSVALTTGTWLVSARAEIYNPSNKYNDIQYCIATDGGTTDAVHGDTLFSTSTPVTDTDGPTWAVWTSVALPGKIIVVPSGPVSYYFNMILNQDVTGYQVGGRVEAVKIA